MYEQDKLNKRKKITKCILITLSILFVLIMLVLPLFSIIYSSLKEGFDVYIKSISTKYVWSALSVTLIATVIAVIINTFF